ncbi:hypothetical protein GQ457_01G054350 [Hibiscus cannabinus]
MLLVLQLEPSVTTYEKLLVTLEVTPPTPFAEGEQGFLNTFFKDIYKPIPLIYNLDCSKPCYGGIPTMWSSTKLKLFTTVRRRGGTQGCWHSRKLVLSHRRLKRKQHASTGPIYTCVIEARRS